jgi:hypothetical protein
MTIAVCGFNCCCDYSVDAGNHCVVIEKQQGFLVVQLNAVVHPGAVVVHFQNALTALAAVVGPRRLDSVALSTPSIQFCPKLIRIPVNTYDPYKVLLKVLLNV